MNRKETWIDETLNSLDGIQRAPASAGIFLKIQARAGLPDKKATAMNRSFYWSVAAGLALLIALNLFVARQSHVSSKQPAENPATMASDYFSYLSPIKL
ncbi:MAG: hypothetical protein WCO44_04715 [Bacteroidota bacterium]